MYREYTLTIRPSRDFLQELLWHGRNIIVLKPENLRQEMIGILKAEVKRGMVVVHPGAINPHDHFKASIYVLKKERLFL